MARTATKERTPEIDIAEIAPPKPKYHHMVRGLASTEGPGVYTSDQIDQHCEEWVKRGYELFSFHPTYVEPTQGPGGVIVNEAQWFILYLFVKSD